LAREKILRLTESARHGTIPAVNTGDFTFTKTLLVNLMAAAACSCLCGCMTGSLWHGSDYVVPSPDPKLALEQTPQGTLVQYDALAERNGKVHREAYYLESNCGRVDKGRKPVFVDPARTGPQTAIPVIPRLATNEPPLELCAVYTTNSYTFTIYRRGKRYRSYDLPVYKDGRETAERVALTPLAVTGDATIIAAVAGFLYAAFRSGVSWDASAPPPP
jgi:hypothetical protein